MLELADILRRHGEAFRESTRLSKHQLRALEEVERCRTPAMGGQLHKCLNEDCGRSVYVYHSCRNRACPKCHRDQSERWLAARAGELLPVPYFHLVFTVPGQLHAAARSAPKDVYGILMREAAASIALLAGDARFLGGKPAVLSVLHTWRRDMLLHPHVHCLASAGGIDPDGNWIDSNPKFLVPVKALGKVFRAKVRDALERAGLADRVDARAWSKNWVVYCRPALQGPDMILRYLARYLYRVAIANSRILAFDRGRVTFQCKDPERGSRSVELPAQQFLARFVQHVLPSGFCKVRYYGLWASANRARLRAARLALAMQRGPDALCAAATQQAGKAAAGTAQPKESSARCPYCGCTRLEFVAFLPRGRMREAPRQRAPPEQPELPL